MKEKLFFIPNLLTGMNIFCGFWAILFVSSEKPVHASWLIILAGLFDLLDGKIARLVGSASSYGIELDSMSDVISFGVAPAFLFYSLMDHGGFAPIWLISFFYLLMGITRLIRFNVTTHKKSNLMKKDDFSGLPIPAAAFAVSSYVIFSYDRFGEFAHSNYYLMIMLLVSILMVAPIRYKSFPKLSFSTWQEIVSLVSLVLALLSIALFPRKMFFFVTLLYMFLYPIKAFISFFRNNQGDN